jgi:hypothetical protein
VKALAAADLSAIEDLSLSFTFDMQAITIWPLRAWVRCGGSWTRCSVWAWAGISWTTVRSLSSRPSIPTSTTWSCVNGRVCSAQRDQWRGPEGDPEELQESWCATRR